MRYTVYKRRVTTYKGVLGTARVSQLPPGRCHVDLAARGKQVPGEHGQSSRVVCSSTPRTLAAPGTEFSPGTTLCSPGVVENNGLHDLLKVLAPCTGLAARSDGYLMFSAMH